MKPGIPPTFITALQTQNQWFLAELYLFTLLDGTNYSFTSSDFNITYGGHIYDSHSLMIEGMRFKVSVGVEVDESDLRIAARPDDATLSGITFVRGVQEGLLDGAFITRFMAFWNTPSDALGGNDPVAVAQVFTGRVSSILKAGRTVVEMKVKSPLVLLDIDIPRNFYQASCLWTLYSPGCTLVKANFQYGGQVDAGVTNLSVPWLAGVRPVITGADGQPYYAQGRILFTSGPLAHQQFLVKTNDGVAIYPAYPLKTLPNAGDAFTIAPGCAKTHDACLLKFNNLANFRAFPFVPPVTAAI